MKRAVLPGVLPTSAHRRTAYQWKDSLPVSGKQAVYGLVSSLRQSGQCLVFFRDGPKQMCKVTHINY